MGGGIFGGGGKPDTSAFDEMVAQANARAEAAKKDAEAATLAAKQQEEVNKKALLDSQNDLAQQNKNRRTSTANRFSLLMFDDTDLEDMLGV